MVNLWIRSPDQGFTHALSSEITSPKAYANRRDVLKHLAAGAAGLGMASWAQREALAQAATAKLLPALPANQSQVAGAMVMDKAMHPLTLLAFGMYCEILPKQNGAPVRLVVPWKYGFKSGKSLVKIRFVDKQPMTAWAKAAPQEYGFFSNVNPHVEHPRWSQATERRIGEDGLLAKKRKTLMFNGYEAQVGSLYAGMDLAKFF